MFLEHIDEEVTDFVLTRLEPVKAPLYLRALDIISRNFKEDIDVNYRNIMTNPDIDPSVKGLMFHTELRKDLFYILTQHGLTLTEDAEVLTIDTMMKLVKLLNDLQNLEDYTLVLSVVDNHDSNEEKFIRLAEVYSDIDFMDVVDSVHGIDDRLFRALGSLGMKRMVNKTTNTEQDEEEVADMAMRTKHKLIINQFETFMGETPTLGVELYNIGLTEPLTLNEIIKISPIKIINTIKRISQEQSNLMAAVNYLSVLMLSKDAQNDPVGYFEENFVELGVTEDNYKSFIEYIKKVYTDYLNFVTKLKQE